MSNRTVKVSWGGQTRRFVLRSTTVEALTSSLASKFADLQGKPFDICYKDEAGDVVTIKETDELVAALSMPSTDLQLIIQLLPIPTSSAPTSSAFDGVVASAVRVPPPAVPAAGAGAGAGACACACAGAGAGAGASKTGATAAPAAPAARGAGEVIDAKLTSEPCLRTVVKKPSEEFTHEWKMTNTGSVAWPYGTYPFSLDSVFSVKRVNVPQAGPGQTVLVSVTLEAPTLEGRYVGYWRLAKPDGTCFGHRFWLDMDVKKDSDAVTGGAVTGGAVTGGAVSGGAVSGGAGSSGVMLGGAVTGGASGATIVMTDAQVDEALAAMHQMGLTDDTLNLQALVATGGVLFSALNYMFST